MSNPTDLALESTLDENMTFGLAWCSRGGGMWPDESFNDSLSWLISIYLNNLTRPSLPPRSVKHRSFAFGRVSYQVVAQLRSLSFFTPSRHGLCKSQKMFRVGTPYCEVGQAGTNAYRSMSMKYATPRPTLRSAGTKPSFHPKPLHHFFRS